MSKKKNYILHGDNQAKSRLRLSELLNQARENGWEIKRVNAPVSKSELLTLARSQSLIAPKELLVIENFFSGFKDAKKVVPELANSGTVLVIWEGRKLTARQASLPGFSIEEFKIPPTVFSFLDSLTPDNAQASLKLLQQAKAEDSGEFLLFMMAQRVRLLIWAKEDAKSLKLPTWQKGRIISQSKKWTKGELLDLHGRFLELDRANKLSGLPENLSASLDLLVASL